MGSANVTRLDYGLRIEKKVYQGIARNRQARLSTVFLLVRTFVIHEAATVV